MQDARALTLAGVRLRRETLVVAAAVVGFAAASGVAAHVRIPLPFSPVPLTLQTLVALLAGGALGPAWGAGSQALCLLAGACGAPVFTAPGALTGVTAGYLLAFPLAAGLVGLAARHRSRARLLGGLLAGTAAILLLGAAWLAAVTGKPAGAAITLGVIPFLPGDALKLAAAYLLVPMLRRSYERQLAK